MSSSRSPKPPPEPSPPRDAREDTDAILSRRRFLIRSGLAGMGLAAASGCRPTPQRCLSIAPVPPPRRDPPPEGTPPPRKARPAPHRAAVDTDGDGIPDERDQCPKTPENRNGYRDEDGCPDRCLSIVRPQRRP